MLNLAVKSFLFEADAAAFEAEVATTAKLGMLKKGPVGKLHNNVVFIRRTPQRRKLFLSILNDADARELLLQADKNDDNTMLIQDNDAR
jgi:hypothetical protein